VALFVAFNLWIGPGFNLGDVVNFNSHFPIATLGLGLFSGTYCNKLLFLWFPFIDSNSIERVNQLHSCLPH